MPIRQSTTTPPPTTSALLNKRLPPRPHPLRIASAPVIPPPTITSPTTTPAVLTASMITILWTTAIDWPSPRTKEPLTGPANYATWHADLALVAQCYGLWYWLEHESPAPADLEPKTAMQAQWLQNRAHALLRDSISAPLFASFRRSGASPAAFYAEIAATVGEGRPIDAWAEAYALFAEEAPIKRGQSSLEAVVEFAGRWEELRKEGVEMPNRFVIQHVLRLTDDPKWRTWRARVHRRWQGFVSDEEYPPAEEVIEEIKKEAAGNIDYW